jgi:ABC-2 type transport system permease protein
MFTMKRFATLIKRELLEHRRSILVTPVLMAGLTYLLVLLSTAWNGVFKVNSQSFQIQSFVKLLQEQGQDMLVKMHLGWLFSFYTIFHIAAAVVMLIYAMNCLFEERKDRSTLFWRSLPVRDWETVLAKSVTLLIVIPIVFMTVLMVFQLLIAALLVVLCWTNGFSADQIVFSALPFAKAQLWQFATQLLSSLWVLPIFAWFLFCSAFAKQRPFLMAMFIPGMTWAVFGALDLSKLLTFSDTTGIAGFVKTHFFVRLVSAFSPVEGLKLSDEGLKNPLDFAPMLDRLTSTPMLVGLVIGLALLGATAYVRRYREDAAV